LQFSGALITGQGLWENPIFWIGEGVAVRKNVNVAVSNNEGENSPAWGYPLHYGQKYVKYEATMVGCSSVVHRRVTSGNVTEQRAPAILV
jgi:hypothetical protein